MTVGRASLDEIDQTEHAIRAVLAARPNLIASDARQAVNTWQRGLGCPSEGAQGLAGARLQLVGGNFAP